MTTSTNNWRVEPYSVVDKRIAIVGPTDGSSPQYIYLDFDDVDHDEIERRLPLIVDALNKIDLGANMAPVETSYRAEFEESQIKIAARQLVDSINVNTLQDEKAFQAFQRLAVLLGNDEIDLDPKSADGWRLYQLLAIFDKRDGSAISDIVQAAREGYERSSPDMNEEGAWEDFDELWQDSAQIADDYRNLS